MDPALPGGERTAAHLLANAARFQRLARASAGNERLRSELLALAASAREEAARLRGQAPLPPEVEEHPAPR